MEVQGTKIKGLRLNKSFHEILSNNEGPEREPSFPIPNLWLEKELPGLFEVINWSGVKINLRDSNNLKS